MSADNQQGSLDEKLCNYIVGFVDGEGTFHVGIHKRHQLTTGWQAYCEFHVSQNYDKMSILNDIKRVLGCGYVKPNHRNSNDNTYVFVVRKQQDLLKKVVPFFERFPFRTPKQKDFAKFAKVVRMIRDGKHLEKNGLLEIARIAFSMYGKGKFRKTSLDHIISSLDPSETACRTSRDLRDKDTVRTC